MENSFALLSGDESEDISAFFARAAKKAEEKKDAKLSSKSSSSAGSVRAESGRGTGGQHRGSRRSSGNDLQHFDNGHANSYQRNNGTSNAYQLNDGGNNGYRRSNGGAEGYRRNGRGDNGYQTYGCNTARNNGNWHGKGSSRGVGRGRGYGQGRALNGDNGFEGENQHVEASPQLENQEQRRGADGGWENVNKGRSFRDANLNYASGRRGNGGGGYRAQGGSFYGVRDGRNHENGEAMNSSAENKAPIGNEDQEVYGGNDTGNVIATTEVSKDAAEDVEQTEDEETKENRRKVQEEREARNKVREEEEKKLTLVQYEKLLLEKRKALDASKPEKRKVTLDRDFESMQLVEKKKEDSLFIKRESEKDKHNKKDEKVRKSVSISEFLKTVDGEARSFNTLGGRVRGDGTYRRGSSSGRQEANPPDGNARQDKFPVNGEKHAKNFDWRGGYARGPSADPSIGVARLNKPVKHVPAMEDANQFPGLGAAPKF